MEALIAALSSAAEHFSLGSQRPLVFTLEPIVPTRTTQESPPASPARRHATRGDCQTRRRLSLLSVSRPGYSSRRERPSAQSSQASASTAARSLSAVPPSRG